LGMEWNARVLRNSVADLTKFLAPLVATLAQPGLAWRTRWTQMDTD